MDTTVIFNPDDVFKAFVAREEWACNIISDLGSEAAERNDLNRLAEQLTDFLERTEIKHSLKENIELILTAGYSMGAYQAELIHLMKGR